MARDINREQMYEAVKTLVECESPHISLPQQKLFTVFSVAFNYMLYVSTKKPGHYIVRIEDSHLAEKLARKSKDTNTRKFLGQMLVPRRLKYNKSMFHLDYFLPTTWGKTCELPKEKIQGAIVIKNTSQAPMTMMEDEASEEIIVETQAMEIEKNFHLNTLTEFVPKTIAIAFDEELEKHQEIKFGFIKDESQECLRGVKISEDISFES